MVGVLGWAAPAVQGAVAPQLDPAVYHALLGMGVALPNGEGSGFKGTSGHMALSCIRTAGPETSCNSAAKGLILGILRCFK